ncbi:reverse transcriptase domain-containing protein [Tanacetum coccineum]
MIGGSLSEKIRMKLYNLLKENLDRFAWKPADMTGVPRSVAKHRLNIHQGCQPIRQKRRGQAPDRNKAIQEEVAKLVEARIMREVHYHDWLLNPVMVKKHDDSWRMCVDFTDLNKSCPKDCYPLLEIDWKVESLCGYPFNLKNARATYQRLVDKAFEKQIGRNLEVYVDDLVIKSHTKSEILRDIEETFHNLRKINLKLNPKKCTFGVEEGAFLGYVVSTKGIKACPEKVEAVVKLHSPQTLKEAQSLNGKLASLNRFISKSAEKSLPFFKTLKRCIKKRFLMDTRSGKSISKHEGVYSETANGDKCSPPDGKGLTANANLFCQPRLESPRDKVLSNGKSGLSISARYKIAEKIFPSTPAFDITYRLRTSICNQVLAVFIAEKPDEEEPPVGVQIEEAIPKPWVLFTERSLCLEGSGSGLILTSLEGEEFTYALRFEFDASNNEAEYEALIAGLRIGEQMGVKNLITKVDPGLVPQSENKKVDALSNMASISFTHLTKQVLVETLKRKSTKEKEILAIVEEEEYCWMTPLVEYLTEGTLPAETKKARTIKIKARLYAMISGVLYRKSFLEPWLRCVGPTQAEYVIKEIHEGSCSMHSGPRSVVTKAIRSGYYWPTMHKDARNIIRTCNDCQTHRPVPRSPQQKLTPITSPWPFYKWGIDISGPFPEAQGKVKFLIVAIDYFTKWINAKPVVTITDNQVKKFVWDNIVCRFGLPGEIISDNGKKFRDNPFKDWCEKLNIRQRFASVEEVPHALWAHRTMVKTSNGDTPFSLTYDTESVIPVKIGMPSLRCVEVNQAEIDEGILLNLDILEERREKAAVREAKSKARMEKYYNAKVRSISFRPGDFVYRSNEASHAKESGKLGLKWEGLYKVIEALGKGAYKLRNSNGDILPRTWNVQDLKRYYL